MRLIAEKLGLAEKAAPPEIDERTEFWLYAFSVLTRGRPAGHGIALPIPPLDALRVADRLSWPVHGEELLAVITEMDEAWLEWVNRKR